MTSPHGPEGQEYPHQPGYAEQLGLQQPEHAEGESQPNELAPAHAASPSGVTAILTAVLAGIGALLTLSNGILGLTGLAALAGDAGLRTLALRTPGVLAMTVLATLLSVACGLLLLAGTVALLRHKMIGRRLIVIGCGLIIAGSLISLGLSLATTSSYGAGAINGLAILSLALPIAIIVTASLPSTTAWVRGDR